jgi:hypothetical protein
MINSLLAELVRNRTHAALLGAFGRTVDKVVEEMVHDLLRDAEVRTELQQLIREAVQQALTELRAPAPPERSGTGS